MPPESADGGERIDSWGRRRLHEELEQASYNWETTRISGSPALLTALSPPARSFFWYLLPELGCGEARADVFLTHWTPDARSYFAALSQDAQLEICGFVCAITHEWVHHVDLLGTPFGANLHSKLCREYLAMQKWAPFLTEHHPELFEAPLFEWLAAAPAGSAAMADHLKADPLGQALVELRGPVMFYELVHGVVSTRIAAGWGPNTEIPTVELAGRLRYEKITVNQVWATIRGREMVAYLGPREILEGRALALNLLFIWRLAEDDSAVGLDVLDLLRRYVRDRYRDAPRYTAVLAIIAGRSIDDLLSSGDKDAVYRDLTTAVMVTWYAPHAPPPVELDDVLQSVTARFVYAARVAKDNDWRAFKSGPLRVMEGVDESFSELGAKSPEDLLRQSTHVLDLTAAMNRDCRDTTMRNWYGAVLAGIHTTLEARCGHGYWSPWGLAFSGNPLDLIDEAFNVGVGELADAPDHVNDWYQLRALILRKRNRREDKIRQLRAWFA